MRIFFLGDIFGKGGRKVVHYLLPRVIDQEAVDLTIANVENASKGIGVSREAIKEMKAMGVQVMTSGNHVWRKPGVEMALQEEPYFLRPANYPSNTPGKGSIIWKSHLGIKVGVVNLLGRIFMEPLDCPFQVGEMHIDQLLREEVKIIIVDFHAEATSEKGALAWFLDGKVSAVLGTHTHIQTADERVLPKGTAFITDVGMTGAQDSVIGVKVDSSIRRFLTGIPQRLDPSSKNLMIHGVLLDICEETGKVIHFDVDSLDFLKNKIPGSISSFQIEVKGRCKECLKR